MVHICNVVLGLVAATVPLAAADIPTTFWRNAETTSAPASTAGMACVDSCGDCMPKLCTDDAVIKGTTTHLTYLCPETKTVQVTETVFITVNGNESKLPTTSASVPRDDARTTTLMVTSKSTLFITKTVTSKHSTASSLGETPVSVSDSLVSSSISASTGEPEYPEPSVPFQNYPEPSTTVHIPSTSTTTAPETMSANSDLPALQSLISLRISGASRHSDRPAHWILTNPIPPSPTASGIWLNTTASDVVSQSPSGPESNSTLHLTMVPYTTSTAGSISNDSMAVSSSTESKSTLYLTVPSYTNSTATSVSTDGIAESSVVNSTLTLVMSSATGPIPTPPVPGYDSSSALSVLDPVLTPIMPSITPGLPLVDPPGPSASLIATAPDGRPTSGFAQLTASVSDNFVSLPSDIETSWSLAGEESTVTDIEAFPTIEPDFPTAEASVSTDGTFFSSDAPPYPTAAPAKRQAGEAESHIDGTISIIHVTTTVALKGTNSTVTVTGSNGTVSGSHTGATTVSLSHNGAGNTQPWPATVVVVVILPFLAALF